MLRLLGILMTTVLASGAAAVAPAQAAHPHPHAPSWTRVDAPTDQQLRGLDAVNGRTAWVGGSAGGVWRTTDGGRTWDDVSPAGADGLLFRDIEARNARTALALSIGEGTDSRIYRTTDGGRTWGEAFVNDDESAFYDCLAMYPGDRFGLAVSDPVDGKFRIISTRDGGASWQLVDPAGMPDAVDGEFAFAASGTCLVTSGHDAYLASGGERRASSSATTEAARGTSATRRSRQRTPAASSRWRSAEPTAWRSAATSRPRRPGPTPRRTPPTTARPGPTAAT